MLLIEAGTHLIFDALMCPYRIGERVRAQKLLRSIGTGMLLMWDRGLHSYAMVQTTLVRGCEYLGRVPANVKFALEKTLNFQAAEHAEISPKRLGFTGTLNAIRRAVPKFQRLQPEEIPFFGLG